MKIIVEMIREMKARGEKIAALTAYDFPMAKLLDECGVPILFVGDSLGMVTLGYPDTTHVTMADMEHHVRAAARAKPNALLGADLPFKSYETISNAVANAKKLIAAGAEFVKAEGVRVTGIGEQGEVGERVADLGALVEPERAEHAVRDPGGGQRGLDRAGGQRRPREHEDLAGRRPGRERVGDQPGGPVGLVAVGRESARGDPPTWPAGGDQRLRVPVPVFADAAFGGGEDLGV